MKYLRSPFALLVFVGVVLLLAAVPTKAQVSAPLQSVASVPSASAPAARPWRMAPERDYGPFVYIDDQGKLAGLSVDVLALVAQRGGVPWQALPAAPLAQQLAALKAGAADFVTSVRPTPERAAYLIFTSAYVNVPAVVVSRDGGQVQLQALNGQTVTVGQGYGVEGFVRKAYPGINWQAVTDDVLALKAVSEGRAAAAVVDLASAGFVMRQHHLTGLTVGESVGFDYALSFGVRKDLPALRDELDAGIRQLSTADRASLRARWLSAPEQPQAIPRSLWWALGLLTVLALLAAVWWWRGRRTGVRS